MSAHVLIISIGPVQDFIAQARRTRDLWFGSHLLSEVSKAAAASVAGDAGSELIFPCPPGDKDLEECDDVRRTQRDGKQPMPYNVANKIVARVGDGRDPQEVAARACERAQARLHAWGMKIMNAEQELVKDGALAIARAQLDDLLELRAVWVAIDGEGYDAARCKAEDELARRKTLVAFGPGPRQSPDTFKSSLDGARETVLKPPRQRTDGSHRWQRYNIGLREELDAIGLLKRTGGNTDQFVPVPTIGLAAWLERARRDAGGLLEKVSTRCQELSRDDRDGSSHAFRPLSAPQQWVQAFPFDAQVMLEERWQPYFFDAFAPVSTAERMAVAKEALSFGHKYVDPLVKATRKPFPYVACLAADGDRMGEAIKELGGQSQGHEGHQKLSRALARFVWSAYDIVEKQHRGVLIYAGGDDVLALVCLQDALSCAGALRERFAACIGQVAPEATPTLSVGLGIGHVLQSLGHLLQLGRDAEARAKTARGADRTLGQDNRDALGIVVEKHSGTTWSMRTGWSEGPVGYLRRCVEMFAADELAAGKVHEIRDVLRRLPHEDTVSSGDQAAWSRVLAGEVGRVIGRNQAGNAATRTSPGDVGLELAESKEYARNRAAVEQWIERMLIARHLHQAHCSAPMRWSHPGHGGHGPQGEQP